MRNVLSCNSCHSWLVRPSISDRSNRARGLQFNYAIVSLIDDVLRKNRSCAAPAAQTVVDQGAAAVEPGFLFD